MKSNVVFSINEGKIKFLQVTATQKKQVTGVAVITTGNQDDAGISRTLSAFIKKRKLNFAEKHRVTVLIPRSRVILRPMKFPSQNPDEIGSMIDLQVGGRIPYSREEVEIDFQILSLTPDGYAKVMVVIVPQEIAMRYWKIFSDAKIPVHGITVSSIGLWSLYQEQPGLSDELGAIIDLDEDHSEICLCTKTYWLTSREIPTGLLHIERDGYAEILKQWELTQSSEQLSGIVKSVYLASADDQASGLGIEIARTQDDLTIKAIRLPKADGGLSLASLAGIAFSSRTPPIDLTPSVVKHAQKQRAYQRQLIILGIWLTAALIFLGLALGMGFFKKNIELARLENQLRETKQEALKVESRLQEVKEIEGMVKGRLIFSDLANEIYRLLPRPVYLVNINFSDGNTLSLEGVSSNPLEINQFQEGMVNSRFFSNVSLDYVNKRVTQQGEVDYFKITCVLKK